MRHEHCCEESTCGEHVRKALSHVPIQSWYLSEDTNLDMSNSLIAVDTAMRPHWNRICSEFLSEWFKLWGGKKGRAGCVFHCSLAQLHLSWYMGNFLKLTSRILKDLMMLLSTNCRMRCNAYITVYCSFSSWVNHYINTNLFLCIYKAARKSTVLQ